MCKNSDIDMDNSLYILCTSWFAKDIVNCGIRLYVSSCNEDSLPISISVPCSLINLFHLRKKEWNSKRDSKLKDDRAIQC